MFDKFKTHFSEIVGWVVGLLGVGATLFCEFATETNGFSTAFIAILATEILLVVICLWNLKIKYSYEKENETLRNTVSELQDTLVKTEERQEIHLEEEKQKKEEEKKSFYRYVSTIISNLKNASKLNNELCNRIPEINETAYHLLETLQASGIEDAEVVQSEIVKSYREFAIALYDLYKRYSSNLLNHVVNMVEAYLHLHGHLHKVSATIKLFDKPFTIQNGERNHAIVYTAFRDKYTYDAKEREIGQVCYTIDGNVDFAMCLRKDQFIINNARKDSESYLNEHKDFDAYYNCAVVVPIRIKQVDNSFKFLGYLCCDCLNPDNQTEVFDKEVAQLLFSLAQIYGTFLETLDSNWNDRVKGVESLPQSFLSLIFSKTFESATTSTR